MSYSSLRALFSAIADAIRAKTGSSSSIKAEDFPTEISNIITTPEGYHDTSEVTATAADVLSPKKIVNAAGTVLTGNISSEGAGTYSAALNSTTTIPTSGKYFTGNQTVSAVTVENLSAENIKSGVTVNVKSGGNSIKSVTGTYVGNVKKLTKTPSSSGITWQRSDSGTSTLPYVEFTTNELGFVPDAIICVDSGQVTQQCVWEKKSYSGAIDNYFALPWLGSVYVLWQNNTIPTSLSNTKFKIPVTGNNGGRNFYILAMKE